MHYSDIRDRVWSAADYAPANSPEGEARTREHINRALMRIALDAPFLFERDVVMFLDPDVRADKTAAVTDAWVSTSPYDAWVLETPYTESTAPDLFARFVDPERPFNGRWMEYRDPTDPTGKRIQRHRIREIYLHGEVPNRRVRMTLFQPVPYAAPGYPVGASTSLVDWRITMRQYALPAEAVEIQSLEVYDANGSPFDFDYVTAGEASRMGYENSYWDNPATGLPFVYWQGEVETLAGINAAPAVAVSGLLWDITANAEPRGNFEYCFTLSLGRRHDEVQDILPLTSATYNANADGRRAPYLESPPTPFTALVEPGDKRIDVTTLDFSAFFGFGSGTERFARTGLEVNLYRRRVSNGTPPSGTYDGWPTSNHFQHIASDFARGHVTFTDLGLSVPGRKLRRAGTYKTLRFAGSVDERYRIHVRCLVKPYEMLDDTDVCEIPSVAVDALVSLALSNLFNASGNPSMAANSFMDYERALHRLKKRLASRKQPGQPWRMRGRTTRGRKGYRHNHVVSQG